MRARFAVFAVLVSLAVAPESRAEETNISGWSGPTAPPLAEVEALALARSPDLAALEQRLRAAEEMVAPAGALANPMVEGMLLNMDPPNYTVGTDEDSMLGVEVRQDLPYPGRREAKRQAARAEAATSAERLAAAQRKLISEVRRHYARLYALDRERKALAEAHDLLEMLTATVAARYGAGIADQEAVLKAQLELSMHAQWMDDVIGARRVANAALNRLLDLPGEAWIGDVQSLPEVAPPPGSWEPLVVSRSREIAVMRAQLLAAEKRLEVARLELKPDFSAATGVAYRGDFPPVLTLRFGVDLPFWRKSRQEPMIRAAEHELAMAERELQAAIAEASAESARLAAEWERAERQLTRYREAILPQTSAALDAARIAYLNNRGDFSTVAEDFELWLHSRLELAAREAERFTIWSELQTLISPDPEPQEGSAQ